MSEGAARQDPTEALISSLGAGLRPVRPLAPPARRASLVLGLLAAVVAGLVAATHAWAPFLARMAHPAMGVECLATLLTGIVAVLAAFQASVPGSAWSWRWAPLPPLALWLAASGAGCLRNGAGLGAAGDRFGESPGCFGFIVGASLPLALLLGALLRRARPIEPLPVALLGALGVAALAAFVLQFFHPFDTTAIDLAFHAAAVALVVGVGAAARRALG